MTRAKGETAVKGLHRSRSRLGLTLIELLVVISLIGVLATLVVVYVIPAFQDKKNVVRGLDRVVTAMLIAKQRAVRTPPTRGLRFIPDSVDPTLCRELQYIEQPDWLTQGRASSVAGSFTAEFKPVKITDPVLPDFYGSGGASDPSRWLVRPGDYFQVRTSIVPQNYMIKNVTKTPGPANENRLELYRDVTPALTMTTGPQENQGTIAWRMIRQPQPIDGEETVKLPENIVIDLGQIAALDAKNKTAFAHRRKRPCKETLLPRFTRFCSTQAAA